MSRDLATVHIVSIHFLIRPLLYTLPVFFHHLDHKLKVSSLMTDLVECDRLHLFHLLHSVYPIILYFLYYFLL